MSEIELLERIVLILENMERMQHFTLMREVGGLDEEPTDQADHDPPPRESESEEEAVA
jgi:hypothetical protein